MGSEGEQDSSIRKALETHGSAGAVTEALRIHGPEVYGLLVGLCRTRAEADDVFSQFAENLWRSFEAFEWKCSVRTWAYLLARRAAHDAGRRVRRAPVPLSDVGSVSAMIARVRTETAQHLQTDSKDKMSALRDALPEEDRLLLILRVDRELPWDALARVFLSTEDEPTPEMLKRESARLRKRFQLVKEKLLADGRKAGLVGP
jgi:RNA polymerase sigma-70 factor, ECF subfamily